MIAASRRVPPQSSIMRTTTRGRHHEHDEVDALGQIA